MIGQYNSTSDTITLLLKLSLMSRNVLGYCKQLVLLFNISGRMIKAIISFRSNFIFYSKTIIFQIVFQSRICLQNLFVHFFARAFHAWMVFNINRSVNKIATCRRIDQVLAKYLFVLFSESSINELTTKKYYSSSRC